MQEHHLTVQKTARYYTLGSFDKHIHDVWFVCHGYGQLAEYFIRHFESIAGANRLIVAPEALSRFYLRGLGLGDRVGATWMTREDRLAEIEDYIAYLDRLYAHIFSQIDRAQATVRVLGFSQGTATVCRWVTRGKMQADQLILWAGEIPPELDLEKNRPLLNKLNLALVLGDKDPYAKSDLIAKQEMSLKKNGIKFRNIGFSGEHALDGETLRELAAEK